MSWLAQLAGASVPTILIIIGAFFVLIGIGIVGISENELVNSLIQISSSMGSFSIILGISLIIGGVGLFYLQIRSQGGNAV